MEKRKKYRGVQFSAEVLREAIAAFDANIGHLGPAHGRDTMNVDVPEGSWSHDSEEEFISDYRRASTSHYVRRRQMGELSVMNNISERNTSLVQVSGPDRAGIECVFEVFEKNLPNSLVSAEEPTPPTIFVGHGRSPLWRDLKDHLHEKHGFPIKAYEIGARAGHAIRDILEEMLQESSIAFLVMTGEDATSDGQARARQNVIHEIGLFQGRLGWARGIILLEEGVEEFSNVQGIQQIRFAKGNIKETFGEVLATLRREFGANDV